MAGVQADGKKNSFPGNAKKYWDELCTSEAWVSYFVCTVHQTKRFGCLFFWRSACSLLFIPGLSPFLSKSKDAVSERKVLKMCFQWKTEQCEEEVWYLKGSFQQVCKSDMQITV